MKKLEYNEFLTGFADLLKKHGITKVWTLDRFVGKKDEGICYIMHKKGGSLSDISEYINPHAQECRWTFIPTPKLSFCCPVYEDPVGATCIYDSGVFYSTEV